MQIPEIGLGILVRGFAVLRQAGVLGFAGELRETFCRGPAPAQAEAKLEASGDWFWSLASPRRGDSPEGLLDSGDTPKRSSKKNEDSRSLVLETFFNALWEKLHPTRPRED